MERSKRMSNTLLGKWGEEQAAVHLEQKGYRILERNYRTGYGEIDLIAEREQTIVFVEVKTRSSTAFGHPEEAVTQEKLTHIVDSAESYLQEHPELIGDWRIDVISITKVRGSSPEIIHFENAV
jgi:putative endonuclease